MLDYMRVYVFFDETRVKNVRMVRMVLYLFSLFNTIADTTDSETFENKNV